MTEVSTMSCRSTDILTAEHKSLLRIADVLSSMSDNARDRAEYDSQDVEDLIRLLREFGDGIHQAKEEEILFPLFTTVCEPTQYTAVRHMFFEHQQDRALMTGIQEAAARSNAAQ